MSVEGNEGLSSEERAELERALRARIHRNLGMAALVLGLVAAGVALGRMRTMFGVSPWEALGIGWSGMVWVLLILGAGVLFSMGTSRVAMVIERLVKLMKRRSH